jgi:hypothetical protein
VQPPSTFWADDANEQADKMAEKAEEANVKKTANAAKTRRTGRRRRLNKSEKDMHNAQLIIRYLSDAISAQVHLPLQIMLQKEPPLHMAHSKLSVEVTSPQPLYRAFCG